MNKIIYLIIGLMIIGTATATENIGTFKKDSCINLIHQCGNCSYYNITAITYPNSSWATSNHNMSNTGGLYEYVFCTTSQIGTYNVYTERNQSGTITEGSYQFEINIDQRPNTTNALAIIIGLGILSIINILIFYKNNKLFGNIVFIGIGLSLTYFAGDFILSGMGVILTLGAIINAIYDSINKLKKKY